MPNTVLPSAVTKARFQTYAFYLTSNLVALLLVLSTPNTRLWSGSKIANDQSTSALNGEALAELLVSTLVSWVAYYAVQGSNPGYITEKHVEEIKANEE
ncbi:hypothetical protein TrRE_jg1935, partial [Triparma retinervis]